MARQEIKYICEVCERKYEEKKNAIDCEKGHFVPTEITKVKYERHDTKNQYPETINVKLKNKNGIEKIIAYRRY